MDDAIRKQFTELKCCIIVPTYNNETTLAQVLKDLLQFSRDIIVVNDGSTDSTKEILDEFSELRIIHQAKNYGKGMALREGFEEAVNQGYLHAITIDSDGQHLAEDLPVFLNAIQEHPESIIIGARNMKQESVPGTSSFGHKFSNFWFEFQTGIKALDTQSGYRCYPVAKLSKFNWFTSKYEFEIESIVRSAWNGIEVHFVPISVIYFDEEHRISHFRKGRDFFRITVLNTVLSLLAIFYHIPKRFFNDLRNKNFKDFFKTYFLESTESNAKLSLAVMMGLFIGVSPLWGFHIMILIALSFIFKYNRLISIAFAHISIPPMIPLIIYASLKTGRLIRYGNFEKPEAEKMIAKISINSWDYIIGAFSLGLILASLGGMITYLVLSLVRKSKTANTNT